MQDTAIKNFCIWARRELMAQVALQARRYGIREDGYDPASADAIEGRPLSVDERRQRADLIRRLGAADAPGYEEAYRSLVDQAAYTWFNRLIAIRFMELNDRLPSHVRMLSAADGSFAPQVLREALDVPIEGLDTAQVSELLQASDDEALFRCLFVAQCRELATCLPDVFEPVGAAMELLLPEGLLRQGSVVQRLVDDIPEEDWREGVEIVGWMYQYYVSERKDEVFASFKKGKKADAGVIAPATQLFTPDWIVRYLTENSLGRLWVQSRPESRLVEQMPYYIPDDLGVEDTSDVSTQGDPVGDGFSRPSYSVSSPESIKVIDPACGSGHILVYAFRLLAAMYEEAGHVHRDIPRLILQNNLAGCEIDPRAAQMASFALAMTACEWDSRFLRRADKVRANIVCLRPAELDADELEEMPYLAERTALLDVMAHMGECGSLFTPEPEDIVALERADDELDAREAGGDLLAYRPHAAVAQMLANCKPLIEAYDAVIANPPYMGSSNMDKWLANWTKKRYPDSKRDLCTCFIERGFTLAKPEGFLGMITASSWMFISSFEKFREKMLDRGSILAMVQQSTHGYAGVTVPTCIFAFKKGDTSRTGTYIRLEDFDRPQLQRPKTEEAIANPDCGWFYRRSADAFKSIPGTPIAYWAGESLYDSFASGCLLGDLCVAKMGLSTGDNERFYRRIWEIDFDSVRFGCSSMNEAVTSHAKWFPCNRGGDFRRWYSGGDSSINWEDNGYEITHCFKNGRLASRPQNLEWSFKRGLTWNLVTSGMCSARYLDSGYMFDQAGPVLFVDSQEDLKMLLAFINSSVAQFALSLINPTLNCPPGVMTQLPVLMLDGEVKERVCDLVSLNLAISKVDCESYETSWRFSAHPLM